LYLRLTGGRTPGEDRLIAEGDTFGLMRRTADGLCTLIDAYDDPAQPYLARPWPGYEPRYSDYAALERAGEWQAGEE
jgi:ATP-dependent helicase/nuclease subunit B